MASMAAAPMMSATLPKACVTAIGHYPSGRFQNRPTCILLAFRDLVDTSVVSIHDLFSCVLDPLTPFSNTFQGPAMAYSYHRTHADSDVGVSTEVDFQVWDSVPRPIGVSTVTTRAVWDETSRWGIPRFGMYHAILRIAERLVFPPAAMPKVISLLDDFARMRAGFSGNPPCSWGAVGMTVDSKYEGHFPSITTVPPSPIPVQKDGNLMEVQILDPENILRAMVLLPDGTRYADRPPSFVLSP